MKIFLSRLHQLQLHNEAHSGFLHIDPKYLFMTNKCAKINKISIKAPIKRIAGAPEKEKDAEEATSLCAQLAME